MTTEATDRDELDCEIFIADNSAQFREASLDEWKLFGSDLGDPIGHAVVS